MARIHPITGMRLEDGSGALPDDQQALLLHVPYIEQTQGEEAAAAMRAKIIASMQPAPATMREKIIAEFVPQFEE